MDQCSKHDIPPAIAGNLADQQGHDLRLELNGSGDVSAHLLAAQLTSLAGSHVEVVDPH